MPKITLLSNGKTYEVPRRDVLPGLLPGDRRAARLRLHGRELRDLPLRARKGTENVNQPTGEELETVEMCTDVDGARLGCQLIVRGDVTIRQLD